MPGKLQLGLDAVSVGTQSDKSKVARAYCEGRKGFADGLLITDNPNTAQGPKDEAFIAWDQGFVDMPSPASTTGCAI